MWVIDLSWFKLSWGIYLILKESKYTAVFLLINDKTQCAPLIFLSSKFMTYDPSFILSKLFLEKSKAMSVKLMFALIVTFYLTKTETGIKKSLKSLIFRQKMLTLAKLRGPWYKKINFLKLHICSSYLTNLKPNSNIF